MKIHTSRYIGLFTGGVCLLLAGATFGDGFRNPPEGGAALGRAGVRLTQGDDATAVTHNPANLLDLKERTVMGAATIAFTETDYTSPMGARKTSDDPWRLLPAVYANCPLDDGQSAVGIGIHFPYGQFTRWDRESPFKGLAVDYAEMTTLNINPTFATHVGDSLRVGVGLDLVWSELKFKQVFPFSAMTGDPTSPDGRMDADGDGVALGANAGLTWLVSDRQRLALVYRSPFSVEYKGDFHLREGLPPAMLPPPISPSSDFDTEIDFPSMAALGYGLQATDDLRLEVNVEWVEHSRNEELVVDVENNNVLLNPPTAPDPTAPSRIPQDWDDTWTVGVGADWAVNESWTVRAGWTYLPTPVPESTLAPALAEQDKNILAVGLGYRGDGQSFDVGYALTLADDRTVDDPMNPVPGKYEFESYLLGISYGCAF